MIYVSAQIIATENTTKNHPRGRFLEGSLSLFQENLARWNIIFYLARIIYATPFHTSKTLPNSGYIQKFSSHKQRLRLIHLWRWGMFLFAMTVPWNLRSTTGAEKASWPKRGLDLGTGPDTKRGANRLGFLFGKDFSRGKTENPSEFFFVDFPDLILNMVFFQFFHEEIQVGLV